MPYLFFIAFALTVPLANWLIGNVGECIPNGPCLIPVGFGLMAPSGVLMIGLAFILRDIVQERLGLKWAFGAIAVGAVLSFLTANPFLALASTVAFVVSEVADLFVYTPLRERSRPIAYLASGVVGSIVDSTLFVAIAFGSVELAIGTALAKIYASAAFAGYSWFGDRK